MNKFQRITVVFFLFVSSITANNLFAQQKDSKSYVPVQDSITNLSPDQDSLFYGKPGVADTVRHRDKNKKRWTHAKKALVWAMVLPGSGQAYKRSIGNCQLYMQA